MLILSIFPLLLASQVGAQATAEPWPHYELTGSALRQFTASYDAEVRGKESQFAGTVVRVSKLADGGTQVAFEPKNGQPMGFRVTPDNKVVAASALQGSNAPGIPFADARAMAVTYDAWKAGQVKIPVSDSAFKADQFTVAERGIFDYPTGLPGYYVTFQPIGVIPKVGRGCPPTRNYRVDPKTWEVTEEPIIC